MLSLFISFLRKLKDSIDPNTIIIDPSKLLNTEIDNIKLEFKRLIEKLIDKTKEVPITDPKALNGKTACCPRLAALLVPPSPVMHMFMWI